MATPSDAFKRTKAYAHAFSKTNTEATQANYEALYKSAHSARAQDVWADTVDYAVDASAADTLSAGSHITKHTLVSLTQVAGSNGQAWYLDVGGVFIKPWISPTDVPHGTTAAPSYGFQANLYQSDNTLVPPTSGVWDIDYYAGIVMFQAGYTPSDMGWGTPKITCYVYTGNYVSDSPGGGASALGDYLEDLSDVDFSVLNSNQILVYGYGNGYAEWTNLDAYDYFTDLGFSDTHTGLSDMPDVYGYNEDHDVRYVAKVQNDEPTVPVPFPGMFWYDDDAEDNYLYSIITTEAAYGASQSNDYILASGTFTITLPAAADNTGKLINIKNIGTGTITVDPNETETIDGGLTAVLTVQYECISIISDGSNWYII